MQEVNIKNYALKSLFTNLELQDGYVSRQQLENAVKTNINVIVFLNN